MGISILVKSRMRSKIVLNVLFFFWQILNRFAGIKKNSHAQCVLHKHMIFSCSCNKDKQLRTNSLQLIMHQNKDIVKLTTKKHNFFT